MKRFAKFAVWAALAMSAPLAAQDAKFTGDAKSTGDATFSRDAKPAAAAEFAGNDQRAAAAPVPSAILGGSIVPGNFLRGSASGANAAPAINAISAIAPHSTEPASAGLLPKQLTASDYSPKAKGRTLYRWSLVAIGAANAADTFSSWGQAESNPALGGTFDGRALALKAGFLGTSFVIQRIALRHNPRLYKSLAWLNFGIAGGLGAAAAHNVSIR